MKTELFNELTKEDKSVLGEMITEILDEMVSSYPEEKVNTQKFLIENLIKFYKKLTVDQINGCLNANLSKYRRIECSMIYGNRPISCHYVKELMKRIQHKLVVKNRNILNELNTFEITSKDYIII
jgi:hypothetical protein